MKRTLTSALAGAMILFATTTPAFAATKPVHATPAHTATHMLTRVSKHGGRWKAIGLRIHLKGNPPPFAKYRMGNQQ